MLKDTSIALVSRGFVIVLGLAITSIVARLLGPAAKGAYDLTILVLRTGVMVSVFGLGAANLFLGSREPEKLNIYATNSIFVSLGIGLICVMILELGSYVPTIQIYFEETGIQLNVLRSTFFVIPLLLLSTILQEIIRAVGQMLIYSSLSLLQFTLHLILLTPLFFNTDNALIFILATWVISNILLSIIIVAFVYRLTGFSPRPDWQVFKQCFRFGMQLHPGNITQFLNYRLDIFLVAFFLSPEAVGLYSLSVLLAERLGEIPQSIRRALMYHVSAHHGEALQLTARTSRIIVILTTPLFIVASLLAAPTINFIFGSEFAPAVLPFIFLLPGIWILSIGRILVVYLTSIDRPIVGTWSALISLVFTIILDLLLIPSVGLIGAAIATSVAYAVASIVILIVFLHDAPMPILQLFIIQKEDIRIIKRIIQKRLGK